MLLNIGLGLAIGGRSASSGGGSSVPEVMYTLWDHSTQIGMTAATDGDPYTLGVEVEIPVNGTIDRVYMWKPAGSTQTFRRAGVWDSSGNLLMHGFLYSESGDEGWIQIPLNEPLEVSANDIIIVGAQADDPTNNPYSAESGGFTTEVTDGVIGLTAVASGASSGAGNGRFAVSANLVYPDGSFGSANYWVDLGFHVGYRSNIPGGYPNAGNTGVPSNVDLILYEGPTTITTNGTILDGYLIESSLIIQATDVEIRNSRIEFTGPYGIDAEFGPAIVIDHCDIVGPGVSGETNSGILASGTLTNNDISQTSNGITLLGGSSTVTGNYIHDLNTSGAEPHYDGISVQGNQDGVLIQHNTVASRDTSNIIINTDFGPVNDITIDDNVFTGEVGYNIYIHNATNVSITDNYFSIGGFSYFDISGATPTITGNMSYYTGLPIQQILP